LWTRAFAQELPASRTKPSPWSVGVMGGGARLYHFTNLDILANAPECCQYERGEAWSFWGGFVGEYAILPEMLSISARILYAQRPLELVQDISSLKDGRLFEVFNGNTNEYSILTRRYTYRAGAQFLVGDVGVKLRPFREVPIYARLSADAAFALGNMPSAQQTGRILLPNIGLRFPDNTLEQSSIREASVPLRTFSFGATGALGAEILLEPRLLLDVEAGYRYGIGTLRTDATDWRMNALQASLGLRWRFLEEVPLPQPEQPNTQNDTAKPRSPLIVEALSGKPLELQETVVTQTFPLLPYIFFDSASVVVKNRYNPRIGLPATFDEQALPKETMQMYYHILHIIGRRMKASPNAILTITGTTDGKEWANADQRQILAMQRARSVASFLTGFWGIPQSRIKLATRDTPTLPSSSRYNEGDEENRRVELSASVPEILSPVVHKQFLEYTPLQEQQIVAVKLLNPEEAESYEGRLEAVPAQAVTRPKRTSTTDTLALTKGTGAPPERLPFSLGRKFTSKLLQYGAGLEEVRCRLDVAQHNGTVIRGEAVLPVKLSKNQYEVSRLNLIVFDFDRDDMRATNEVMLRRFTQEAVKPASQVRITGSTDRLGEQRYNQELSESRAKAVQEVMKRVNPRIQFLEVRGTGASTLPFDNDTPEGRYYCRTVRIDVQTPRG
jgi:outer membrane protein OmpA-like peptidoglycan-associated protein